MSALSLFPPRVKIVDENGLMTPEFYRALNVVFQRVGGAMGDAGNDIFAPASEDDPINPLSLIAHSDAAIEPLSVPRSDDAPLEPLSTPQRPSEGYAVGMVAITVSNTNPQDLIGYGTWVLIGQGKTLVGYSSGDPDFGTAGATGGVKTITIEDHPNHTHTFTSSANAATPHLVTQDLAGGVAPGGTTDGVSATLVHLDPVSGTNFFKTLPPFLVVFFWQRTA